MTAATRTAPRVVDEAREAARILRRLSVRHPDPDARRTYRRLARLAERRAEQRRCRP